MDGERDLQGGHERRKKRRLLKQLKLEDYCGKEESSGVCDPLFDSNDVTADSEFYDIEPLLAVLLSLNSRDSSSCRRSFSRRSPS